MNIKEIVKQKYAESALKGGCGCDPVSEKKNTSGY